MSDRLALRVRVNLSDDRVGHQEAQELQEGIQQGISKRAEGHFPFHPLNICIFGESLIPK